MQAELHEGRWVVIYSMSYDAIEHMLSRDYDRCKSKSIADSQHSLIAPLASSSH